MKKTYRKAWQTAIGVPIAKKHASIDRFYQLINKSIDIMLTRAESELNPLKYPLSDEAKKRLKWIYIIQFECMGNITMAANKIGISRQWLSPLHSKWQKSKKDPRSLEPKSRAPKNTDNRKRIGKEIEDKIIEVRKTYYWGKNKLMTVLDRDYDIQVGESTINRYLDKNGLLDVKISKRIKMAHENKITEQKQKYRPPKEIKDYKPGALIEKDMKYIIKRGQLINLEKWQTIGNCWYQHTAIDSFTRIRTIGLAGDSSSNTAVAVQEECESRFPFNIACANTDNGAENEKDFDNYLEKNKVVHFYSRSGTPTDNPRVERSHLTDEMEFYRHGNICKSFEEQKKRMANWEYIYNHVRPHQALGNLTPMAFYELWKKNPKEAHKIAENWKNKLKKQSKRLANSRKIKNRGKITRLMEQIEKKLKNSYK